MHTNHTSEPLVILCKMIRYLQRVTLHNWILTVVIHKDINDTVVDLLTLALPPRHRPLPPHLRTAGACTPGLPTCQANTVPSYSPLVFFEMGFQSVVQTALGFRTSPRMASYPHWSSCFSLLHSSDYRCLPPHSASSFKWCFHCTYKHIYILFIHAFYVSLPSYFSFHL